MMKISVIIPTYKPKDYLWECLDSLVNQTFSKKDFEVIMVLNGCEEPYKSDIEKYISTKMQGMNVYFIHTLQGGVSNARNLALDQAKGEYVTFIDDDDYISTDYLKELYEKSSPNVVTLCYPYAFKDGDNSAPIKYAKSDIFVEYAKLNKVSLTSKVRKFFSGPCMKLIPMSFIQDRRYDIRFKNGEDSIFMFLISDKIKRINFTSDKAIYYRRFRYNSAITSKRSRWSNIKNSCKMMHSYISIYFSSPFKYNFIFFITRLLGAIKSMVY